MNRCRRFRTFGFGLFPGKAAKLPDRRGSTSEGRRNHFRRSGTGGDGRLILLRKAVSRDGGILMLPTMPTDSTFRNTKVDSYIFRGFIACFNKIPLLFCKWDFICPSSAKQAMSFFPASKKFSANTADPSLRTLTIIGDFA